MVLEGWISRKVPSEDLVRHGFSGWAADACSGHARVVNCRITQRPYGPDCLQGGGSDRHRACAGSWMNTGTSYLAGGTRSDQCRFTVQLTEKFTISSNRSPMSLLVNERKSAAPCFWSSKLHFPSGVLAGVVIVPAQTFGSVTPATCGTGLTVARSAAAPAGRGRSSPGRPGDGQHREAGHRDRLAARPGRELRRRDGRASAPGLAGRRRP